MFKSITFSLMFLALAAPLHAELTNEEMINKAVEEGKIEVYSKEIARTSKLTPEEVLNVHQYCLGEGDHPEYVDFRNAFGPDFNQHIMKFLHADIANQKKYYLNMQDNRRLVYFRIDTTYYLQLVTIDVEGNENVIVRYFTNDDMGGCIRSLPDSCKFQGNQVITYEKKCRVGKNVGKTLIQDMIDLSTTATEEEVSFEELMTAFKECYQPMCYSVPFDCLKYSLNYDPTEVYGQLQNIANDITQDTNNDLTAYVEAGTLTLKYSGTTITPKFGVGAETTAPEPESAPAPLVNIVPTVDFALTPTIDDSVTIQLSPEVGSS